MTRADKALAVLFTATLAVYLVIFGTAFADLPLRIPPWHQLLLLYFHFFPMCFLQLLLCRQAGVLWRLLVPLALLAVPGAVFLNTAGWMVMGWILFLWWCVSRKMQNNSWKKVSLIIIRFVDIFPHHGVW